MATVVVLSDFPNRELVKAKRAIIAPPFNSTAILTNIFPYSTELCKASFRNS